MKGAFWIVGILLLVGTFVGARMIFDNTSASTPDPKSGAETKDPPDRVICWGNFDVEKGVAFLYPRQFGNVIYIHPENVKVKEGEVLLKVDDALARLKAEEAQSDVLAGEAQLAEAKKLPQLYQLQKEQQQSAIQAAKSEIDRFKQELESKLNSVEKDSSLANTYRKLAKFGEDQLTQKKLAEEAKLKQIDLQDADLKIKQAEADLAARKVRLKQAQEMLTHFKITAPSDGYVMRVHVHKGETLGPNPRIHALEFVPDAPVIVRAEVLQEWGRFVKEKQEVIIEDDTYKGPQWKGEVKSVLKFYAPTRTPVIEPFRYNDVRTLECIITLKESGVPPPMIGQRVRAQIKVN